MSLGHPLEIRSDFETRGRFGPPQNIDLAHNFNSKKQNPANGNLRPAIGSVEKDKATDAIDPPRCYTLYTDSSIITPNKPGRAVCHSVDCRAGASRPELLRNAVPFFSSSRESFVVDTVGPRNT